MPTLKRTRSRAAILLALTGIVAVVTAVSVGILGYLAAAATAGIRDDLRALPASETELRLTLPPSEDPTAQDAEVRALVGDVFRNGARHIPMQVDRYVRSVDAVPVVLGSVVVGPAAAVSARSAPVVSIGAGSLDGSLREVADLVGGTWPDDPAEVSVQAETAAALGVAPGSAIRLGDAEVMVTAVWRLRDDYRGRLATDPLFSAATGAETSGPVVIDETAWPATGVEYRAQWAIAPEIDALQGEDLAAIQRSWADLPGQADAATGLDASGLDRSGRLVATSIRLDGRIAALGAIGPLALLIVAAIALLAVLESLRLVTRVRAGETALLWSRGASDRSLAGRAALEAGVFAVAGALLGLVAAAAAVSRLGEHLGVGGSEAVTGVAPAAAAVAAVAVATVAIVSAVVTTRSVAAVSRGVRSEETGRVSRVSVSGALVLLVVAAGLAMWQLRVYGSPVVPTREGGTAVDPVAVIAPALALAACAVAGFAVVALIARPLDRGASRSVGLAAALVPRNWARRLPQLAMPFALAALACGQIVFASGYAATWNRAYDVTTRLHAGAELALAGLGGDLTPAVLSRAAAVDGVDGVAPAFETDVVIGSEQASLVAVAPDAVADVAAEVPGILNRAGTAESIGMPSVEAVIPADAVGLTVETISDGFSAEPGLTLLVTDALGRITRAAAKGGTAGAWTVDLSGAGTGPWRLVAVDVDIPAAVSASVPDVNPPTFAISAVAAADGTAVDLGESWVAFDVSPRVTVPSAYADPLFPELDTGAPRFDIAADELRVRLMPSLAEGGDTVRPRIAVSAALAERSDLSVGDVVPISVDARWDVLRCTVSAVIPAAPGAADDRAVLMDGGIVQSILLRAYTDDVAPSIAWIDVAASRRADGSAVAAALRDALPARVAVRSLSDDPSRAILGASAVALGIGASGTALLTLIALTAVASSQLRGRRDEVLVLRALGIGPRRTARLRGLELAAVIALGALVGIVAGFTVAALAAPAVSRSALPDLLSVLPIVLLFDPVALSVGLGGFAAAVIVLMAVYAAAVRRQARPASRGSDR